MLIGCEYWPLRYEGTARYKSSFSKIEQGLVRLNWQKVDCQRMKVGKTETGQKFGTLLDLTAKGKNHCFVKNAKTFSGHELQEAVEVNAVFLISPDSDSISFEVWTAKFENENMPLVKSQKQEIEELLRER